MQLSSAQAELLDAHRANMARLGLDPDRQTILFARNDAGARHYEQAGRGWDAVVTERGLELERLHLVNDSEALYQMARDVTFSMACRYELANRVEGLDARRLMFAQQLELMGRISPDWQDRLRGEIEAILAEHPYSDLSPPPVSLPEPAPDAARSRQWIGLAIVAALVLAALAAHYPLWQRWRTVDLLASEGVTAQAAIIDRSISYPKTGQTYHLEYRYETAGSLFERSEVVEKYVWDRYEPGDKVTIRIARSDATIAAIAPEEALMRALGYYGLIDGLLLLLFGGALWRLLRQVPKDRAREENTIP